MKYLLSYLIANNATSSFHSCLFPSYREAIILLLTELWVISPRYFKFEGVKSRLFMLSWDHVELYALNRCVCWLFPTDETKISLVAKVITTQEFYQYFISFTIIRQQLFTRKKYILMPLAGRVVSNVGTVLVYYRTLIRLCFTVCIDRSHIQSR